MDALVAGCPSSWKQAEGLVRTGNTENTGKKLRREGGEKKGMHMAG